MGPGRESRPGRGAGLEVTGPSSEAWLGTTDFILCAGEAADMGEQWVCCMEPLSPGGGGPGMPLSLSRASRAGGSQGAAWTWLGEPRLCVGRASAAPPSAPCLGGVQAGPGSHQVRLRGWTSVAGVRRAQSTVVLPSAGGGDRRGKHLRWEGGVDWTSKTERRPWSYSLAVSPACLSALQGCF